MMQSCRVSEKHLTSQYFTTSILMILFHVSWVPSFFSFGRESLGKNGTGFSQIRCSSCYLANSIKAANETNISHPTDDIIVSFWR